MITTLTNCNVTITGGLKKMKRKDAFALIRAEGGFPRKKVSGNTDVLIIADELYNYGYIFHKTDKIRKATEMETEIISEAYFYDLVGA